MSETPRMARYALTFAVALAFLAEVPLRAQDVDVAGELVRNGDVGISADNSLRESTPSPPIQPVDQPSKDLDFAFTGGIGDHEEAGTPSSENTAQPRRLAPRQGDGKASAAKASLSNPTESLITMGGSLCVVLTLFFGLAWITRRGLPKNNGKLPGEVIEVLGKTPLVKGQELQLVRVGAKLLLICVTPTGCETLTEIVDRGEVDRLSTICRSNGPASMTTAFNQVLTGIGREPATGFAGSARTLDRRGGRAHA